jgi:hypothetical protein
MKKIIFISLLTSTLFAEHSDVLSDFLVDQDVKKVSNEDAYGKKSTYSLLFAKHELTSQERDLHFYYGAKMGFVSEEYENENGFGIPINEVGAYYAAAVGMEYDLSNKAIILAEAVRSKDEAYKRHESKLQLTYTYNY